MGLASIHTIRNCGEKARNAGQSARLSQCDIAYWTRTGRSTGEWGYDYDDSPMSESPVTSRQGCSPDNRPVIGLCGGIGSGKSTVAKNLAELGCAVSNADAIVRELLSTQVVRDQLVSWWGSSVLKIQGEVDRSYIAQVVFSDEIQRRRLEGFLHPLVNERRKRDWAALKDEPAIQAFVIDAPLLFEAGLDTQCDAVIFVDAPQSEREGRVTTSRGWGPGELARREKNQMPLEMKRKRSDYLIVNDGSLTDLYERTSETLKQILTAHRC